MATSLPSAAPAAAEDEAAAAAVLPACRICLQDDDADTLENPCSCSGSMAWAHHACIQRWINEKHDRTCEICKQQFRGDYAEPPPRPQPAPLVAQLQIDNADNRIVLLSDPETGAIVARVVMPPGADLAGEEELEGWRQAALASAEEEQAQRRRCGPCGSVALVALLLLCVLAGFTWLSAAATEEGGEAGPGAGAWLVRIMLLATWVSLRMVRPGVPGRRQVAMDYDGTRQVHYLDLEAGLQSAVSRRARQ